MNVSEFLSTQTDEVKNVFETLNALILKYDKAVVAEVGSIMSVEEALVYKQENVFKYGLTLTKHHFSYHSMVMYAYPKVLDDFKKTSNSIKFQKGCFNFKSLESINLSSFETFLKDSAQQDFTSVVKHYKSRKK